MTRSKILVVDDSEIMRAHVVELLTPQFPQCTFEMAQSPGEALKKLLADPTQYCFVLTDHVMGTETGLQFLLTLQLIDSPAVQKLGRAVMTDQGRLSDIEVAQTKKHNIRVLAKPSTGTEAQFIAAVRDLVTPCLKG